MWSTPRGALFFLYGLFFSGATPVNFVPLNDADNWLHVGLAAAMILLGLLLGRRARTTA